MSIEEIIDRVIAESNVKIEEKRTQMIIETFISSLFPPEDDIGMFEHK